MHWLVHGVECWNKKEINGKTKAIDWGKCIGMYWGVECWNKKEEITEKVKAVDWGTCIGMYWMKEGHGLAGHQMIGGGQRVLKGLAGPDGLATWESN